MSLPTLEMQTAAALEKRVRLAPAMVRRYVVQRARDQSGTPVSGWCDELTLAQLASCFDYLVVSG